MNYNTDKPIDTEEQDLLGRAAFSKQLGKAVYEYNAKYGLVIGLFGKWGTGKTSVINMAENEINRLAEGNGNKPLIMRFAPWNYSDKDSLISLFFQSLKNKIDVQDNEEIKKKLGKALSDYAGVFDALSLVPVVGSGVATILKTLAQTQGTNLMQVPDLDKTRKNLEEELITADKKIIIVIDDIDRLTNSQIRDIFQLVKQVADFPNVIYILVMDRTVVRGALTEIHNIDGNKYLEKIIQVPFELPELRKTKLHNILYIKLKQIIHDLPNVVLDEKYWGEVFKHCISPYINTLRDINRLANTFQFKYAMLYQETSFEDMLAITTLEVLEPQLYKWICDNKDAVCGGVIHRLISYRDNKPNYRKLYHDEFVSMGIDPNVAISCISTMFPVFANDVNEYKYVYQSTPNIIGKMRVANEVRFELYFMFDLDDIKVPRSEINACIFEYDRETLYTFIEEINKKGYISYFLEEIRSLDDNIPYERLSLIASVLLDLHGEFEGEISRGTLTISAFDTANYFIVDIIKKINTEEEKYQIIRSALEKVNKNSLTTIARIINGIENSYERLEEDSENRDKQIISLEHLKELEKIYIEKIRIITNSESISDINRFDDAFYLWKHLDEKGVSDYLKKLFECEVNKLKFICSIARKWIGINDRGWSFSSESYEKYISQDEVYNSIQNFDKNRLYEFTETEQIKLASFVLNYQKVEIYYVDEQEAQKIVNKWKA